MIKKEGVSVILKNSKDQILAVAKFENDFHLPSGFVEVCDTTPLMATQRMVTEVVGLKISNLELVLCAHMDGYMRYTYLGDYDKNETVNFIERNEPFIVKWVNFSQLIESSSGEWNEMVYNSLMSMGFKVKY